MNHPKVLKLPVLIPCFLLASRDWGGLWQWGGFRGCLGWISCLPLSGRLKKHAYITPCTHVVTSRSAVRFLSCHRNVASLTHLTLIRVLKFAVFAFCVLCLCLAFCVLCLEAVFSNIIFFSIKSLFWQRFWIYLLFYSHMEAKNILIQAKKPI